MKLSYKNYKLLISHTCAKCVYRCVFTQSTTCFVRVNNKKYASDDSSKDDEVIKHM